MIPPKSRPDVRPGAVCCRVSSRYPNPRSRIRLYETLVPHARFSIYYRHLGVPDTPEGRFEILALHVGLTVRRLLALDDEGRAVGQALFDLMIADLDMNLRELGVGDLSVGKQVKRLAGLFYARLSVLNEVFDEGQTEALAPMLRTNVFRQCRSHHRKRDPSRRDRGGPRAGAGTAGCGRSQGRAHRSSRRADIDRSGGSPARRKPRRMNVPRRSAAAVAIAAKSLTLAVRTHKLPPRSRKMVGSSQRKVQDVTCRGRPVRPVVKLESCRDTGG